MFNTRYRYIFVVLLGVYSYLNIMFTEGHHLFGDTIGSFYLLMILMVMVLGIWEGNRLIEHVILTKLKPKPGDKLNQLFVFFLFSLINVTFVSLLGILLATLVSGMEPGIFIEELNLSLAFTFRVNLFLHCVNAIIFYVNRYKGAQLEAEKMKKLSIESKYEALKNQVNPHFLFNSLNVLSTLVYKNQDLASEFVDKLSAVYRYLLNSRDKKLITLEEEIDFLKSYMYLLKTRFQDNVNFKMTLSNQSLKKQLPPASLQLLFENAIKHNIISSSNPLEIEVRTNGEDYLHVTNNLQLKPSGSVESNGLGLSNIMDRYKYFTEKEVMVSSRDDSFQVAIPLLDIENK